MYKKAIILTSTILLSSVLNLMAQDDDMYFTPRKKTAEEKAREAAVKEDIKRHSIGNTYYVGSNRDVDEYNRRGKYGSYFEKVGTDSVGNDIIEFHVGDGTYPALTENDTTIIDIVSNDFDNSKKKSNREYIDEDSYTYSRNFSRFDGFYSPYFSSWYYRPGYYHSYFGFYDPWYWDPWYYNAWYDPWFDPWYDPFYYGPHWHGWGPHYYWGGYRPIYYIGTGHYYARTGTSNHGATRRHGGSHPTSNFSGSRYSSRGDVHGITSNVSARDRNNVNAYRPNTTSSGNFSGYRGAQQPNNTRTSTFNEARQSSFSRSSSSFSGSSHGSSFSGGGGGHSGSMGRRR